MPRAAIAAFAIDAVTPFLLPFSLFAAADTLFSPHVTPFRAAAIIFLIFAYAAIFRHDCCCFCRHYATPMPPLPPPRRAAMPFSPDVFIDAAIFDALRCHFSPPDAAAARLFHDIGAALPFHADVAFRLPIRYAIFTIFAVIFFLRCYFTP